MTTLNTYLRLKREAYYALQQRSLTPGYAPQPLAARVSVEGRSGVRRIRIRDFQILTDSPHDFVGYDLGPSSPELVLGALGSCIAHSWLIQAAAHGLPVEALEVVVTGQLDQRASVQPEMAPEPQGIAYTVLVTTEASDAAIAEVDGAVQRLCPILNLLRRPQPVSGEVARIAPPAPVLPVVSPEGVA